MKTEEKFNFFVPFTIQKGKELDADGLPKELIIDGIASTGDEDLDGEMLDPNGAVVDQFLKSGFLTYEHRSRENSAYIIGEPMECSAKNNKLYLKGKLYKSNPKAVDIYKTALMLEKEKSNRQLGYSIEGSKIKTDPRNPKKVLAYKLTNCTITSTPKNSNTYLSIVKGTYDESYVDPEFDESANGGNEYLLDITKPNGSRIVIDKNFKITIVEKAMSAGVQTGRELTNTDTNGAALKRESLGKKLVNLQPEFKKAVIKLAANFHKFDPAIQEKIKKSIKSVIY